MPRGLKLSDLLCSTYEPTNQTQRCFFLFYFYFFFFFNFKKNESKRNSPSQRVSLQKIARNQRKADLRKEAKNQGCAVWYFVFKIYSFHHNLHTNCNCNLKLARQFQVISEMKLQSYKRNFSMMNHNQVCLEFSYFEPWPTFANSSKVTH
jgi:hypothetical protein